MTNRFTPFLTVSLAMASVLLCAGRAAADDFLGKTVVVNFDSNTCYPNKVCNTVSYEMKYYFAKDGRVFAHHQDSNAGVVFPAGRKAASATNHLKYQGKSYTVQNSDRYSISGNKLSMNVVAKNVEMRSTNRIGVTVSVKGNTCQVLSVSKNFSMVGSTTTRQWVTKKRCAVRNGRV